LTRIPARVLDRPITRLAALFAVLLALVMLGRATPATAQTLTSVSLPPGSQPQEVAFDASGTAWVGGWTAFPQTRPRLYRVPPSGAVAPIVLDTVDRNKPQGVVFAAWDDAIYVCLPADDSPTPLPAEIIRVSASTGAVLTRFPLPVQAGEGGCWDLVDGPDRSRRIYFTGVGYETIGYVSPDAPGDVQIRTIGKEPGDTSRRPFGITPGPDGSLWFTLFDADAVGRVDVNLNGYTRFDLPGGAPRGTRQLAPRDIVEWGGKLWVTATQSDQLFAVATGGSAQPVALPRNADPNRASTPGDGNLWFSISADRMARYTPGGVLSLYPLETNSRPRGSVAGPNGTIAIAGEGNGVLYRLPLDLAPTTANLQAAGAADGTATIAVDVDARGVPSTFAVDFGPTADYGGGSGPVDAGAFDGPARRSVTFGGLQPGVYHFRVRAGNAFGERVGADQTVEVPVGGVGGTVLIDADGDGQPQGVDCDDGDPQRFFGKPEVPGNRVDEDCDGTPQDYPKPASNVDYSFERRDGRWFVTRLRITGLPAGATLRLTCTPPRGRSSGCPFKPVKRTFPKGRRRTSLLSRFHERPLVRGVRLQVRVQEPQSHGRYMQFRIKRKVQVTKACLRPGRASPVKCPV
jgi:streptogramin lyase